MSKVYFLYRVWAEMVSSFDEPAACSGNQFGGAYLFTAPQYSFQFFSMTRLFESPYNPWPQSKKSDFRQSTTNPTYRAS